MGLKCAPKEYIIKGDWGKLFMRYLGVKPKVYGPEISYEELMRLTADKQLELIEDI